MLKEIVYVLRKTSLTLQDIGKLSPSQFILLYNELLLQEAEEKHEQYSFYNVLLSVIHNAPISKPKIKTPDDFYQLKPLHKTDVQSNKLEILAEKKGIKLPKK